MGTKQEEKKERRPKLKEGTELIKIEGMENLTDAGKPWWD